MIIVDFNGTLATIHEMNWKSDNEELAKLLNEDRDPLGTTGADPYPDRTEALKAIDLRGGWIVHDSGPPETVPGRVY